MRFHTFGEKSNKAVLLIHTLFTSADFFAPVTSLLASNYYVIVPTLSGHYENSTFISTDDEIRQIKEFLSENGVASLYAVAGFSLGGNIAYEFFCNNAEMIEKAAIDSAPLFNFPNLVKNHFLKSYSKSLNNLIGSCYNTKVYKLPQDELKKVTFIYGSKDIARLCNGRLKKYHIHKMKGYGHCGFYRENPVMWVEQFIQ